MAYDGPTIHSMPLAYGYPPASACISRYSNNIYIFYKVYTYTCIRDKSLFYTERLETVGVSSAYAQ